MREHVTKGWFVEGILDSDEPNPLTREYTPRRLSRVFQVYQAAAEFAELTRRQVSRPQSVNIRTKSGYDDAAGLCG